ncbi:unnamed protein product [Ixodes hexagonus]
MTSHIQDVKPLPHHARKSICGSRASYRQGRRGTAVKVYTINQESRYLLISNVNAVGAAEDLKDACLEYGDIADYHAVDGYETEQFTESYLVKYVRIQSARIAKKKLDEKSFFGAVLHVCYAPEFETVHETREKLEDRRRYIAFKTGQPFKPSGDAAARNRKRLHDDYANNQQASRGGARTAETPAVTSYIWAGQEYPLVPSAHTATYSGCSQASAPLDALYNDQPLCFNQPSMPTQLEAATEFPATEEEVGPKKPTSHELATDAYERTISLIRDRVKGVSVPNTDVLLRKRKL